MIITTRIPIVLEVSILPIIMIPIIMIPIGAVHSIMDGVRHTILVVTGTLGGTIHGDGIPGIIHGATLPITIRDIGAIITGVHPITHTIIMATTIGTITTAITAMIMLQATDAREIRTHYIVEVV